MISKVTTYLYAKILITQYYWALLTTGSGEFTTSLDEQKAAQRLGLLKKHNSEKVYYTFRLEIFTNCVNLKKAELTTILPYIKKSRHTGKFLFFCCSLSTFFFPLLETTETPVSKKGKKCNIFGKTRTFRRASAWALACSHIVASPSSSTCIFVC